MNNPLFRCTDLIQLNIISVHIETVLSLIRANWMLWLVGAGSKLALLKPTFDPAPFCIVVCTQRRCRTLKFNVYVYI